MLKVIIMTDDDPVDSWVALQLAQQFPIAHSILLYDSAISGPSLGQKLLASPLRVLSAIPRELIRNGVESQRESIIAEQLWQGHLPQLDQALPNVISVETEQINRAHVAEQIRALSPDLLLVCGGAILDQSIYSIPRLGSWNLQWGISDRYRGQHGVFFPLALEDFDAIGATLHQIDSGINTGEVLFQFFPALEASDTESSIEIKIARAMVPHLVQLLETLQRDSPLEPLQGKAINPQSGQTIRYRDRSACLESKYHLRRKLGRTAIPPRQERQHNFLNSSLSSSTI